MSAMYTCLLQAPPGTEYVWTQLELQPRLPISPMGQEQCLHDEPSQARVVWESEIGVVWESEMSAMYTCLLQAPPGTDNA